MRSLLYFLARRLGDANSIRRGTIWQRVLRVLLLRRAGGWINRIK